MTPKRGEGAAKELIVKIGLARFLIAYEMYERESPTVGVCDHCGKGKRLLTTCIRAEGDEAYAYICSQCADGVTYQNAKVKAALEASASSPSNDMAELAKAKKLVDDAEKDLKLLVDSDLNMAAWGTSNPHINRARRDILTIRGELIRASEKLNLIAHPEKRGPVA